MASESEVSTPLLGDAPDRELSPRPADIRPTNLDLSGARVGHEGRESYQGPHDWRKRLRPVQSPIKGVEETDSSSHQKANADERQRPSRPLPPWKRDLIEKNKKVARLVRRESSGRSKRSPIVRRESSGRSKKATGNESPSGVGRKKSFKGENPFTQQVVNENSGSRRHISPANSFKSSSGVRRTPSDKILDPNDPNTKKRIERVRRARLYLLQQIGPNSFLIVGDSPEHKFRVIIGPQTCSCAKGSHCVHVLFVMLRVFQVSEVDPYLWSKQLKNYEVESLFRVYNEKRSQRIEAKKSRRSRRPSPEQSQVSSSEEKVPCGSDVGSVREEEDMCPICLLEMVEGESLLKCNFCQNRLHHHCITVWFDECKRQNDPLICPLCRTRWKQSVEEAKAEEPAAEPPPLVPPNTRVPSPQLEAESTRLPYAEPIPGEYINLSTPWTEILGEDLVACLFSRNWSIRETGLKHMAQEMRRDLLRVTAESQSGAHKGIMSLASMDAMIKILQCCFSVVTFMCQDPVYKVFVACLKVLHVVFAVLPSRDNHQRDKIQTLLHPVVNAIIIKCTDGNRRTSQLSISTMVELAKGQNGELALGREFPNPGLQGLGGMSYLVGCLTEKYRSADITWQWLLGRLYVIEKLVAEFPTEFLPRQRPDGASSESSLDIGAAMMEEEKPLNYYMLMRVAEFAVGAVSNRHARISRVARRVFLMCVRYSAHLENLTVELEAMLNDLDLSYRKSLRRQLEKIVAEFQLTKQINCQRHDGDDSDNTSPDGTPLSTPRCPSPVTTVSDCPSETGSNERNLITAPPNTPIRNKRQRLGAEMSRNSFDCIEKEEFNSSPTMKASKSLDDLDSVCKPRKSRLSKSPVVKKGKSRSRSNTPQRMGPVLETNLDEVIKLQEELNRNAASRHNLNESGSDNDDDTDGLSLTLASPAMSPPIYNTQVPSPRLLSHDLETDIDSVELNLDDILKEKLNVSGDVFSPDSAGKSEKSRIPTSRPVSVSPVNKPGKLRTFISLDFKKEGQERVRKVRSPTAHMMDIEKSPECLGASPLPVSPPSNSMLSSTPKSSRSSQPSPSVQSTDIALPKMSKQKLCKKVSESSMCSSNVSGASLDASCHQTSSEDMMMSMATTPCIANEKPVTFRSEVAMGTPKHSPSQTLDKEEEDCLCKEEVEKEEALALAKAMEISSRDQPVPIVPGLTPFDQEQVISIRIQPDSCDAMDSNGNPPILYYENIHWKKGILLGTGAFSTCYQARDVKTGTIMALKQISFCRNSRSEQEKVIESITEEILMMSKLDHPHIVRIMGATRQGCHFNMFAEWMPGGSVSNLLSVYGAFSEGVMTNYILQVLRGLAYLHDNHILHRDLKGANLLVDGTGRRLRIGDFGSAARLSSKTTGAGEFQGQLLGTIAFMAPEVLRGENYGRACDVWSVGCCMIEMATTKPPWNTHDVSNHLALIFKIANAESNPPIPEKLSPPVRDMLLRCVEPSKEQRPTAKDLLIHPLFTQYMESML